MACDDHACSKLSRQEDVQEEMLSSTLFQSKKRESPSDASSSPSCDSPTARANDEAARVKPKGPLRIGGTLGSAREIRLFGVDLKEQADMDETISADQESGCSSDMSSRVASHGATAVKNRPLHPSYSCNFCNRKFVNCQALGGHQNAHKRQRQKERKAHIQVPSQTNVGKTLSRHSPNYKQGLALSSQHLAICAHVSHPLARRTQDCPKKKAHKTMNNNANFPSFRPFQEVTASSLSNSNVPKSSRFVSLNHTSNICPSLLSYEQIHMNESLLMVPSSPKTRSSLSSILSSLTTSSYKSSCTIPPIVTMPSPCMYNPNPILHQSLKVHSFPSHGFRDYSSQDPTLDLQLSL